MRQQSLHLLLVLALILTGCSTMAQPGGKSDQKNVDEKARDLVSLGRRYFRGEQYPEAANAFELAAARPINQLTTYSHYMAGLSYYKANDFKKALKTFDRLQTGYPRTTYAEDIKYHESLIYLASEGRNDQEKGLDGLLKLAENTNSHQLKKDAELALRNYLFYQADFKLLDLYKVFVDAKYLPWIVEAIAYRYDQENNGFKLLKEIEEYQASGLRLTPYLDELKVKYSGGHVMSPNRLNVAVFLSFNLQQADTVTGVPKDSEKALQMFEGMKIAADTSGKYANRRVNIRIFDTQGDTTRLKRQLDSLTAFRPDVIIGDIRTALVRPISKWAEQRQVLHLVPRNPFSTIVDGKRYTFLLHPALQTHGEQMARQMYRDQNKRRFVVFNDSSFVATYFTDAFRDALDSLPGAEVTVRNIARSYEINRKTIPNYVRSLRNSGYDAVYIPLSSEESAGLIISQLKYHSVEIPVIGGPDWELFNVIDPDLKTRYELQYSAFYFEGNDSLMYDSLYTTCLREYGYKPTQYTVQGFDIMAYVMHLFSQPGSYGDLGEMLRRAPVYKGIHQNFYFDGRQINQEINIMKFRDGRIEKVNWNTTQ